MPSTIPANTLEKFTTFGDLLRFLRRRAGLTQMELATAVGYSDAQISRLEQNLRLPDIPTIEARFILALGIEAEPKAIARLLDLAANVRREDSPVLGLCPYKGLNYFDEADADLFVGREELTAHLASQVLALARPAAPETLRFLAVVGASGSGKSSLVRAGLVPALRWDKACADWRIHILTPTSRPLESLARSLSEENGSLAATADLIEDLARSPHSLHLFARRVLRASQGSQARLLLVVDQFEELFALCRSESEREAFINNLLVAAGEDSGPVLIVITLRADFYAQCSAYLPLRVALARQQEYIGAMTPAELRRAIEEPARRGRWECEPGLVELLLHEVGQEPGALPLLSHALMETWQRRRGRTLTLSGYTSSGGVRGAIAETAETVFSDHLTPRQRAIARRIFLHLTEVGDDNLAAATRRRVSFGELYRTPDEIPDTQEVLKTLTEARLVITNQETVEVAHEALIREWPTLRGWLEENRDSLRLHRRLTEAAREWLTHQRAADGLYRGVRLSQAREWAQAHPDELNIPEQEFLLASQELAEYEAREREMQRQRELDASQQLVEIERRRTQEQALSATQLRQRSFYLAVALAVTLVLALAAGFLWNQGRVANRVAQARELAAAAISSLDLDPERSLLLALEANARAVTLEGESALHQAILASRVLLAIQVEDPGTAVQVMFSPDGQHILSTSPQKGVSAWEVASGNPVFQVNGRYASYSPDGKILATILPEGRVQLWDAASGAALPSTGQIEATTGIAFSPDGTHLASVTSGNLPKLWALDSGEEIRSFPGHSNYVSLVFFSPDGASLLSASDDGTVRIWDVQTGTERLRLAGHPGWVQFAAFSPDGTRVASLSQDQIAIWDAASGARLLTLNETNLLVAGAFSPDGTWLAVGGQDRRVRLFEVSTGREIMTLAGHNGTVISLAFGPDGRRLVSGSTDGSLRIWDLTPSHEALTLSPLADPSHFVAFDAHGTSLLGSEGGLVRSWDARSGAHQQVFETAQGLAARDTVFALSEDGATLASANQEGQVTIWQTATAQPGQTWQAHTGRVNALVFHPSAETLASASDDYKLKIWPVSPTGPAPEVPEQVFEFSAQVKSLAYSPDGALLAVGLHNGTAKILEANQGEERFSLRGHSTAVIAIAFNQDGSRLATAGEDGSLKIWNGRTGQMLYSIAGHVDAVTALSFSPDGTRLASASQDGTARVWESGTGLEILTLYGDGSGLNSLAFSPDGGRLAAASDTAIWVYILDRVELLELARSRVTRLLSHEECLKYLHRTGPGCAPSVNPSSVRPLPLANNGRICLVTQEGSLNESAFNQMAYQGLLRAGTLYRWESTVLESASIADIEKNMTILVRSSCNLIVSIGPFVEITAEAARANPQQRFLATDFWLDPPLENVWVQTYAVDQAAFLAGYTAAALTRSNSVGTFGGIDIPQVTAFMDGFALGIAYYNEKHSTQVRLIGWDVAQQSGLFVGGFCCSEEGDAMASELLAQGVDILLPVAGESVGWGAGSAVQRHGQAWIIGVDTDWTQTVPDLANVVLTSIEKRYDISVLRVSQAIADNRFTGGYHIGDLQSGEVRLSPLNPAAPALPVELQAELEQIQAGILAGEILTRSK